MHAHSRFTSVRRLLALAAFGLTVSAAGAQGVPPSPTVQVPGFFHQAVGTHTVTALYDGYVKLAPQLLQGLNAKEIQTLLARTFQAGDDSVQTAVNGYLVHGGNKLILVDAGAARCFGPTMGHLVDNLRAAGYRPEEVDTVLLTHMHPDHLCGLVSAEGQAVFPRATVWGAKEDADYWLDPGAAAAAPEARRAFFAMAQAALAPYAAQGRFRTFAKGDTLPGGIGVVPTPGHTPGHASYLLQSGAERLLIWGDIIHAHGVQLTRPEVSIEFDVDPAQAVRSRRAVLARAADEGWWVAGAHLPFPGLGRLRPEAAGYAWVPVEYGPLKTGGAQPGK
ncbi:MBL fold metallo-hydrolase [Thauera aromatica]|uniref:MBL fold metallo-hydrolase n=1 Tax=Thauera aromatica TaxID=59405 RepID=UPI001FFDB0DE|nr:MBL fold metallo-hydrolase [Thauera aromatica]MCK2097443.1 MBL fold metallo-hydrolase [Thauera aromatica]